MSSSVPVVLPALQALAASSLPQGAMVSLSTVTPAGYQPGPGDVTGVTSGVLLQLTGIRWLKDDFAVLGPNFTHEEDYSIQCVLTAWAGDPDFNQRMQDAFTIYADLSVAIGNSPRLGLTNPVPRVSWPRLLSFSPQPDPFGRPAGIINFEVRVEARVTSLS